MLKDMGFLLPQTGLSFSTAWLNLASYCWIDKPNCFMRWLLSTLLTLNCLAAAAQSAPPPSPPLIQYPVKGYVLLSNNEKVVIRGLSYTDSSTVLLYSPGSNVLNGAYTFKDDIRTMQLRPTPVADIKMLRAKRQSFLKGATVGGLIGLGVGLLVGYATYQERFELTDDENKGKRATNALAWGIAGAVPAGIAGGLSGGLFIKKRFYINGRRDALEKTLKRVSH